MSRVLLFTQTGGGRPKYVGRAYCERMFDHRGQERWLVHKDADGERWFSNPSVKRETNFADRWWLVECDNAEAGRTLILRSQRVGGEDEWTKAIDAHEPVAGRVLASGGRQT